ncbi:IniB N-terminal domain-containing protein [Actinomycetospora soli]|uniref:IniB N-terminal domain-containing protein n=1 Tax=Actinomycetospora soli TaxID=2893887 RepID=UPI001E2BED2A|nr:IniB N-terminal domain-containing protein [Actinomycetospora soli]MCD2186553.1 IniB N-terminal domain-containing protein [Actinomycetospora soli]
MAEKTLLEFLMDLLSNHEALADFRDNPEAALHAAGLGDVCVDDIKELLPVVLEKVDAEKCAQYEDDCDDDHCYDAEPKHHDDDHHCKPIDCDDEGRPAAHCSPIEQSIAHLNYVTNNYNFVDNSHNTYNETNNITKIWAGDDADIHVDNTTTNVGEHGSFIGGDNNAPVVTGDHSFVGDGNQVSGDGSTTAFGAGNATSLDHVGTGDGGVISTGSGTVNNSNAFGDGNQVSGANGENTDSHNDNSTHTDNSDQDNSSHVDSSNHQHDVGNTDTDASTHDSGNTNTDASTNLDVHHNSVDLGLLDHAL